MNKFLLRINRLAKLPAEREVTSRGNVPKEDGDVMFISVLKESVGLYLRHWWRVMTLIFVGFGVLLVDPLLLIATDQFNSLRGTWRPVMSIPAFFLGMRSVIAVMRYTSSIRCGQPISLRESLLSVRGRYWSFIFYQVLLGLAIYFGLIFLIVPGLLAAAIYGIAPQAIALENNLKHSPFAISRRFSQGQRWMTGTFTLIAILLTAFADNLGSHFPLPIFLRMVPAAFATMFMAGFSAVLFTVLYERLKEKAGVALDLPSQSPVRGMTAFFGSLGLYTAVIAILGGVWLGYRTVLGKPFVWRLHSAYMADRGQSPVLPNGIRFSPPKGWLAYVYPRGRIRFWNPANKVYQDVLVQLNSRKYMPATLQEKPWNAETLREYLKDLQRRDGVIEETIGLPDVTMDINGRKWVNVSFRNASKRFWRYYLHFLDDQVIYVTVGRDIYIEDKAALEKEESEIQELLASATDLGVRPMNVYSNEMEPALERYDQAMVRAYGENEAPKRGDIIEYEAPGDKNQLLVLRVVGLPGEEIHVRSAGIYVNGQRLNMPEIPWYRPYFNFESQHFKYPYRIPEKTYYVLPDNFMIDLRSDMIGPIPRDRIKGRITEISYPRSRRKQF